MCFTVTSCIKTKANKMKNTFKIILVLVLSMLTYSCNTNQKDKNVNYALVHNEGSSILVEKFDSLITDENKFNWNNEIFKVGSKFTYAFKYSSANGEMKYFKPYEDDTWEFVDIDSEDKSTVKNVIIETLDGNPMREWVPGYNQTSIAYRYGENTPFSMSGVIDNEANIWMHPPRDDLFKILELNPFPFIKTPYEIGTEWNWELIIGSQWGDERWKTWEGNIRNNISYKITDIKTLNTELGKLKCFVVESKAKSKLGKTSLKAFFNPDYGFVKMNYTNIDGSKLLLELVDYIFNG